MITSGLGKVLVIAKNLPEPAPADQHIPRGVPIQPPGPPLFTEHGTRNTKYGFDTPNCSSQAPLAT